MNFYAILVAGVLGGLFTWFCQNEQEKARVYWANVSAFLFGLIILASAGFAVYVMVILATPTPLSTSAPTPNTEASTATENSMATVLCGPFRIIETPLIAFGKLIKGDFGAVLTMPHDIQDQVEVMMGGVKSVITSDDTPSPK